MALKEFIGENRLAQVLTLLKNHIMTGASSGAAGASGFVPAPSAGDQDKVLKGDGTWGTVASDDTFTLKNQSLQFAVTTETVDYTVVDNEGDFAVNKSDIDSIVISCSTYPIAQLCVYYSDGYADHSEVFRDATEPITLTLPSGKDTVSHIAYGMDDGNLTFSILFNKHTAVAGNHVEIANTNVTANSYVEAYFNDASIATATNSVVSVRAEAGKIVFDSAKSMLNTLVCDIVVKNSGSTTSTTYTKGQTNIFSVPNGGNTAEVLEKQSSANGDVAWAPVATQMTWAQYQALTTDQKNDGRVRVITDRNMSPILAEGQTAVDTKGIVTTAGEYSNTQALLDALANADVELTPKSDIAMSQTSAGGASKIIYSGTYFYLDGVLMKSTAQIAKNAAFTDQNCVAVSDVLNDILTEESVSVTGDGVKTKAALLNELFAKVDYHKLSLKSVFSSSYYRFHTQKIRSSEFIFTNCVASTSALTVDTITLKSSGSTMISATTRTSGTTFTDESSDVASSGTTYKISY